MSFEQQVVALEKAYSDRRRPQPGMTWGAQQGAAAPRRPLQIRTGGGMQDIPTFTNTKYKPEHTGDRIWKDPQNEEYERFEEDRSTADTTEKVPFWMKRNTQEFDTPDVKGGLFQGDNFNNFEWLGGEGDTRRGRIKNSESTGQNITWTRQGAEWVPTVDEGGGHAWDTNKDNRHRNTALGALAALMLGGAVLGGGAAGGAAASGAGAEAGAAGGGALGAGSGGGGGSALGSVEAIWPGASGGASGGGYVGALEGSGMVGGGSSGAAAGGMDWTKLGQQAMKMQSQQSAEAQDPWKAERERLQRQYEEEKQRRLMQALMTQEKVWTEGGQDGGA